MAVGLDGSESGVEYQLLLGGAPVGTPVAGTGVAISFGQQTAAGTYTVEATTTTTPACGPVAVNGGASSTSVDVIERALPLVQTVEAVGSTTYCSGGNLDLRIADSQTNIDYELYLNGAPTGDIQSGTTGSPVVWNVSGAGVYTVYGYHDTLPVCLLQMSGSVTVSQTPDPVVTFNVTGGGTYCTGGSGMAVGLDGSESGVEYQLLLGGAPVGTPVAGTGVAISFGQQTAAGTYTVEATTTTTPACGPVAVNGGASSTSVDVIERALPLVQTVEAVGSTTYCSGGNLDLRIADSQTNIDYELYLNGAPTGDIQSGTTGSPVVWNVSAAGVYTVYGYHDTLPVCLLQMSGSVTVSQTPDPVVTFNVTGGGTYCSGGSGMAVGLDGSESGVEYQLLLGGAPVGTPVAGTGVAISFGQQTAAGTYTVEATTTTTPACGPVAVNGGAIDQCGCDRAGLTAGTDSRGSR